ncbi:hypothetical protein [Campylobacter concisus]|nr:hypothetical protein [Campylobacter concisus]
MRGRVISSNLTRFGCVKFDSHFFSFTKFYIDSSSNLNAGKFKIKMDKFK